MITMISAMIRARKTAPVLAPAIAAAPLFLHFHVHAGMHQECQNSNTIFFLSNIATSWYIFSAITEQFDPAKLTEYLSAIQSCKFQKVEPVRVPALHLLVTGLYL